ncbi:MAG: lysyl oxidase family protein [Thermoplasmatota archaeon]
MTFKAGAVPMVLLAAALLLPAAALTSAAGEARMDEAAWCNDVPMGLAKGCQRAIPEDAEPLEVLPVDLNPLTVSVQTGSGTSQVPCSDEAGCPDLIVDARDLRQGFQRAETFSPSDCNVQEGSTEPGTRQLLRFSFTTPNIGLGDLIVGRPSQHPEWFEWGACHGHWHFREYADYRLWTVDGWLVWNTLRLAHPDATAQEVFDGYPDLTTGYVDGHKQGFCIIDLQLFFPASLAGPGQYYSCGSNQGISVGYADSYYWGLDGQFIDVTDVPSGVYVLEAEVNAERLYVESDYVNNRGVMVVRI